MLFLLEASSQIMDVSVFHMSQPAINLVDAFFALCQSLEWKRVGVITDSSSRQTTMLSNYLQYPSQERNTSISVFLDFTKLQMKGRRYIHYILNELKESGTKIKLLTAYPSQIADILCTAYQSNMVWPQYAWVIYVLHLLSPGIEFTCEHDDFLEGLIFLSQDFTLPLDLPIQSDYSLYYQQKNLIRDAIALLKKAGNMSQDIISALRGIYYGGLTGNIRFDSSQHIIRDIVFLQVKNGGLICQAKLRNGSIEQNKWLLPHEQFPTSDFPVRVNTVYPLWLNIVDVIVYTIAITAVFVLFIYFHNEPEIRATSWLLSLLMILSCYVLVANLLAQAIHTSLPPMAHFNTCSFLIWVGGYGVPPVLIIAVLLVKMLCVYHIFHNSRKLSKLSSDYAMAVYIILIISPYILVLVIMTVLNSYRVSAIHTFRTGYVEVKYICMGNLTAYFLASLAYLLILVFCTAVVAWTTRKLRLRHFWDAKKVNGFFLTFLFTSIPAGVLYDFIRENDLYLYGYIIVHTCYNVFIFSCLGFLFMPKIYPIVIRKYFKIC